METLSFEQMEKIEGGKLNAQGTYATGLMCGMAAALLFTGVFAPLAAAPGVGCAIGLYVKYS